MNVLRRTRIAAQEVCEVCATPIGDGHGHLVDMRDRRLLCACRPCYLLFVPEGAAQGRYRAVGDRYLALDPHLFAGPKWEALQIPIGLAFFFYNSSAQKIAAFYPGPGGATESLLPLEPWDEIARDDPRIASMRPDVEATLVYRRKGEDAQAFIVPIDVCYELVGIVRTHWQGFEGGQAMRDRVDEVFARIRERCG